MIENSMGLIPVQEKNEIVKSKEKANNINKASFLSVARIIYEFLKVGIMLSILYIVIANFSKIKEIALLWGFKTFYENVFVGLMGFGIAAVLVYYVISFAAFWIVSIIGTLFTPIKKK